MSIFQQRKIVRKIVYSWGVFILVCVIIFVAINQIIIFYYKNEKIVSKLNINNNQAQRLEKDIKEKTEAYEFIRTERGKEEYYRDVYPLAKDGEKVIVLYNSTDTSVEFLSTSTDLWTTTKKKFRFFIDNYTNL